MMKSIKYVLVAILTIAFGVFANIMITPVSASAVPTCENDVCNPLEVGEGGSVIGACIDALSVGEPGGQNCDALPTPVPVDENGDPVSDPCDIEECYD